MAIYSKTTKQMMVDLINEGNPQLPFPINATDFEFTVPEIIPETPAGHNTSIRISARPNTDYVGNVVLTYRRLNIGYIFRNMTLLVDRWMPNIGMSTTYIQLRELLPLFGEKYGFNFIPEEWYDQALTGYNGISGHTFNIRPLPTNLAFVGAVAAKWLIGEQSLETLLPVDVIPGRQYPGGNDFAEINERKYWVNPDNFDYDYSAHKDVLENPYLPNVVIGYDSSSYSQSDQAFIDACISKLPVRPDSRFDTYIAKAGVSSNQADASSHPTHGVLMVEGGLNGIYPRRYTLPNSAVPEANSEFYNRCIVLDIPDECEWATGRLFFHYNV